MSITLHKIASVFQANKPVPVQEGTINVFPNRRHKVRADGLGMPALSPMLLGPVVHGEPGLPAAQNIENYFQFAKVFADEIDPATGLPGAAWQAAVAKAYADVEPHRHKRQRQKPTCAARLGTDGRIHCYTYVQSRLFYCMAYEKLVRVRPEYQTLVALLDEGKTLQICGFDAHPLGDAVVLSPAVLYEHYTDDSKPFGHERVLAAMLALRREKQALLPWHRYLAEHADIYAAACY